MFLIEAE